MLLGGEPTIHLPTALEFASLLPDDATLVWKTNAHATAEARALLDGVFDVWVADYKFGNDACAQRLAKVPDYTAVVRENLRWAHTHTDLIVRHLLMPGHVDCCWRPIAEWLAAELPGCEGQPAHRLLAGLVFGAASGAAPDHFGRRACARPRLGPGAEPQSSAVKNIQVIDGGE